MKAIRIEHPSSGNGLWQSERNGESIIDSHSKYKEIEKRHSDVSKFPCWRKDGILRNQISEIDSEDYFFAFLSLDQLNEALTSEELKECINTLGFQVLLLELKECISSPFQIIFKKENILKSEDISFMFI